MIDPLIETGITIGARALLTGLDLLITKASADEAAEIRRLLGDATAKLDTLALGPALDETTRRHLDRVAATTPAQRLDPKAR